jgi:tetratricopeptide (TPR) repeat protein
MLSGVFPSQPSIRASHHHTEEKAIMLNANALNGQKPHAIDPEAYDDYLRGRYFWARRTEPDLMKAKEYFEKAIAKDPAYAPAYSGLADTYFYPGYIWGHIPPREAIPLSQAAARKAIELDDQGAEGHASLGTTHLAYDWDMRASEEELKRAIELNPNYGFARHMH